MVVGVQRKVHKERTTTQQPGYPFAVLQTDNGLAAGFLQFPSMATAATLEELQPLLQEQVALYLLDCHLEDRDREPPEPEDQVPLQDYREEGEDPEVVYAEPALWQEGIIYAELARRIGRAP